MTASAPQTAPPTEDEANQAIARILGFKRFGKRKRLDPLLRYIVAEEFAGRGEQLKAFSIAMDVMDRGADFDPQKNSIVRVEMGRLRQALDEYYGADGKTDPLRIVVPTGTYRPQFEWTAKPQPESQPKRPRPDVATKFVLPFVTAAFGIALAFGIGYWVSAAVIA